MFPDPAPAPPAGGQAAATAPARAHARLRAGFEVLVCSAYPTQLAVAGLLRLAGLAPTGDDGRLSAAFVFSLSLIDAVVLLALVAYFLRRGGESPRRLFLGDRPPLREAALGVALLPLVFAAVFAVLIAIQALAPGLRNVPENPLGALTGTPLGLAGFVVVAIVAGGLREELQRAFLLHRFEQHLGGPWVGVLVTSAAFGLGHTLQGWDAAGATGTLGLLWALVYLRRRSVVAGVVSHALFNCAELLRAALGG
ncbi:MAG: CPBP family intramembrane glutamic endopeptidase [Vicinamibacterales bacterium]